MNSDPESAESQKQRDVDSSGLQKCPESKI